MRRECVRSGRDIALQTPSGDWVWGRWISDGKRSVAIEMREVARLLGCEDEVGHGSIVVTVPSGTRVATSLIS